MPQTTTASAVSAPIHCTGLIVQVADFGQDELFSQRLVEAALSEIGQTGFWVSPIAGGRGELRVRRSDGTHLSLKEGWALATALDSHRDVASAEPTFFGPGLVEPKSLLVEESNIVGEHDPKTNKVSWALDILRVPDAWKVELPTHGQGKRFGDGILIGHPDTGYTLHDALAYATTPPRLKKEDGYDYVGRDADPLDDLAKGFLEFPGHGTSTASVIFGETYQAKAGIFVGVARKAQLMPLRVSRSVIHLDFGNLTEAIYHATNRGCHVISMSLGGPFGPAALHRAVKYAVSRGVILLAASGNYWPWVVYPAAFDEVIAVAATDVNNALWDPSGEGPAVDVSAPGHSVWHAEAEWDGNKEIFDITRSSGTSFAVAHTAGVAALWLAHHGRDRLIGRYGAPQISSVFKELLMRTAKRPADWPKKGAGVGIVDAHALLSAPLPASPPAGGLEAMTVELRPAQGEVEQLLLYFRKSPPALVREVLLQVFGVEEPELAKRLYNIGDELRFLFATQPPLRMAVEENKVDEVRTQLRELGSPAITKNLDMV